jgi:hypothetical protein
MQIVDQLNPQAADTFIRLRPNTLQLVGAQRTYPPELWRRSRLDGAAGSFIFFSYLWRSAQHPAG